MAEAPVGDDVYGEDPSINRLEALAAEMVGKEAAVYVPSGTMGNQAAVMTHTQRGDEVLLDENSHIFFYEVGGLAVLSGVQTRTLRSVRGAMNPGDVSAAIRPENIHFPRTTLLCLENTHNRAGGRALPVEYIDEMADLAHSAGLKVHLDGARIFNAAEALGVSAGRVAQKADSVMFCLSKGLSAPVGSIVAGTAEFIEGARRSRKILGGGMRQAGILAQAGIVALEEMVARLGEDHRLARQLAEILSGFPGIEVTPPDTNIVSVSTEGIRVPAPQLAAMLAEQGVLANAMDPARIRLVTHKDVMEDDVRKALGVIEQVLTEVAS